MNRQGLAKTELRPAGYEALIRRYELSVIPNWRRSFVATRGSQRTDIGGDISEKVYPPKYWPGESLGSHLEFALKYDGTNLAILASLFRVAPQSELLAYLNAKPNGKYVRRVWFFYEYLTGSTLPLNDLKQGNYIDLLDPDQYYTTTPSRPIRRQRINDNLLGDQRFCPTIRRTDTLHAFEQIDFTDRCQQAMAGYSPELLKRTLNYLYTKETKSSFEIEHIKPNPTRTERFVALLQLAERDDFCDRRRLIELQNRIVDSRFRATDYREVQSYVGESIAWQHERIHFVCPKPEALAPLIAGLITTHSRMERSKLSAVVHAAAVAYGFVFLHPFEDGNGRIHRFLIHNILARRGFTPEGVMFPLSALMLKKTLEYDASLEAFSRPLMSLVDYSLDEDGVMTVHNETASCYAYIDMTPQAEALFRFIEQTIDTELAEELSFLAKYDEAKKMIQEIVDLPDRQIDLFIRFSLQNSGQLSSRKRRSHFDLLSDEELSAMEQAVQSIYNSERAGEP